MFKVLLCDDNAEFLELEQNILKEIFEEADICGEIVLLHSSEEMILLGTKINEYQLALVDVEMGGMNGIEVIDQIRIYSGIPVAFVSSFIDYALDGYKVNAVRYILKQPRGLKAAILECIGAVYKDMGRQEDGILFDLGVFSNSYIEDDLDMEYDIEADELTLLNLDGAIYRFDGEVTEENTPAKIVFHLRQGMQDNDLKMYCYDGGKFVAMEFCYDAEKHCVTADVERLSEAYCLGYEKFIPVNKKVRLKLGKKAKYSKQDLISSVKDDFFKEKGLKAYGRTYTVSEAVDIVLKYDSEISKAAKEYKVKKEVIQAVLIREIICHFKLQDEISDMAVENYYYNQQEREHYISMKWWQQLLYGMPNYIYPQREDSSTGLGQIYAKTAIGATNYLGETKINYDNWKERKVVWFSLKKIINIM